MGDHGPTSQALEALPPEVQKVLRTLLDEPPLTVDELREEVRGYLRWVEEVHQVTRVVSVAYAKRIAVWCTALLDDLESTGASASSPEHRLVQAGIRYFVENEDAERDTTSPIGFQDDADVIKKIAAALGRAELLHT